jgi:hypothetical protein
MGHHAIDRQHCSFAGDGTSKLSEHIAAVRVIDM